MAFIPIAMMAYDCVVDGIYYNLVPKAKIAYVTRASFDNKEYSGDIAIPPTFEYDGTVYTVTKIERDAFNQRVYHNSITSIIIPSSVTTIDDFGLSGCPGLTSIVIPSSVTSIGKGLFSSCPDLISISVDPNNSIYDSRDNSNAIIETSSKKLISACNNTTIPSSVKEIGNNAFSGCSNLTSINIPDGVTAIGDSAFSKCSNLTSINIPDGVTSIGKSAFFECSNLTSINIPNGLTGINAYTFSFCGSLKSIIIPDGVTYIGNYAFHCSGLTSITIPNSVTRIGAEVFSSCLPTFLEYHTNLKIKEYYTEFGYQAGIKISNLETLIIGDEVTSIENTIVDLSGCTNLKNVTIGSGITSVGDVFQNCENLEVVTCRATTVPATNTTAFDGSYIEYATLIVPDEAYNAYSTTAPWSNFGTILRASQISTVTANDYTREYGDANPDEWEYTVVGQALIGEPARTCAADETSTPGTYPIVISKGTVTNDNVTYVNGTLTITKAPLTITANSYTIKEGDALPTFDAVFTGLKNNEPESVVNPVITPTATDSNTPGTYDINVTATSDNYDITIEAGTLTILPTKMSITIGAPGVGTYCSPYDLDFSTVTDFKAYIATGYNSATGNVIVQAVKDVPAGTGLFLKGTPGTYDVPCGESSSYYVNMLVGVTEATTISATDGNMTNFLLSATNTSDACFRPISSTYNLKANRAYLQIPTSMVSSSAGANSVGIEFEEGVTGIDNSLSDMDTDAHWFTLDGRRLNGKPTQKGIYVVNGQKVVIK